MGSIPQSLGMLPYREPRAYTGACSALPVSAVLWIGGPDLRRVSDSAGVAYAALGSWVDRLGVGPITTLSYQAPIKVQAQ